MARNSGPPHVLWVDSTSHSYARVTDHLWHDKYTVYEFLSIILDDTKAKHPAVETQCALCSSSLIELPHNSDQNFFL